ncbi:LPP20 family lipoprotein [Sulfurimonas sp.]|jgi:hypothetical protein|uniref:LPP20 family lipoprotein n=1 Tax=Sulfurimonas sp. TaxID=2022749 RepID=UPI0025E9B99D|nr:LPP20 family lipoprotein [Sulfurimonas sp.]MBT5935337.1 hypothetical protein [Sulfurimonas sp.]
MKIVLFIFLPILSFANPSWFYNLEPTNRNELIGYGIDKELVKAKQKATTSIVEFISVKIQSTLSISDSDVNGEINSNSSSKIKSEASAVLSGVKVLKSVKTDGKWYVAVKYDNSPLEKKFKKLLPKKLQNEKQNQYLKNTPLVKSLNSEIKKNLNYKIIRKDNLWQISYKDIFLPISQDNFYKLFSNTKSNTISIKANKREYKQNDKMYFKIHNKDAGYISILYVEHNGKVGVLLSNRKSDNFFNYPNGKDEDTFTIVNPYKGPIKELYIAIYSKTAIDLDEFESVSDDLLDKTNFNFHKLIAELNNIVFSSYVVKIKK